MNHEDKRTELQFREEMETVRATMLNKVSGIGGPLSELVIARVGSEGPNVYAGIVLCAGYSNSESNAVSRMNLAAALQLLHVALDIHQLLVDASLSREVAQPNEQDKNFIGSTILAGDYCFSHAAELAASTQNPTIVARFSTALQDVSANRLRNYLYSSTNGCSLELAEPDPTLIQSGVAAAIELSDLAHDILPSLTEMALGLLEPMENGVLSSSETTASRTRIDLLPPTHQVRWLALIEWLSANASS